MFVTCDFCVLTFKSDDQYTAKRWPVTLPQKLRVFLIVQCKKKKKKLKYARITSAFYNFTPLSFMSLSHPLKCITHMSKDVT